MKALRERPSMQQWRGQSLPDGKGKSWAKGLFDIVKDRYAGKRKQGSVLFALSNLIHSSAPHAKTLFLTDAQQQDGRSIAQAYRDWNDALAIYRELVLPEREELYDRATTALLAIIEYSRNDSAVIGAIKQLDRLHGLSDLGKRREDDKRAGVIITAPVIEEQPKSRLNGAAKSEDIALTAESV